MGKDLYNAGQFKQSSSFLEKYVAAPNSLLPGKHLLGYAYANLNEPQKAIELLKPCVKGIHDE